MTAAAAHREPAAKFFCLSCGEHTPSKVLATRDKLRRRECLICGDRYPTIEVLAPRSKPPKHRSKLRNVSLPFE